MLPIAMVEQVLIDAFERYSLFVTECQWTTKKPNGFFNHSFQSSCS